MKARHRAALLLAALLSACVPPPPGSRPGYPGSAAHDEIGREYTRLRTLAEARHREQMQRVERVAKRLLATIPNPPRVQFTVVRGEPSINAGATFGQVTVTSGMLNFVRSDDEMAVVLAHELAHITQGHVTKGALGGLALNILAIVVETQAPGAGQLVGGVGQLFLNRFTQSQERDADHVGLATVYQAGYDPSSAVDVQERLAVETPQTMAAGYFDTHPSSVERAVSARRQAEELLAAGPPPGRSEALALEREAKARLEAVRAEPGRIPEPPEERGFRREEIEEPESETGEAASSECDRARVYVQMARDARSSREAEDLFRRALRYCPDLAEARRGLSRLRQERGEPRD